MIQAKSNSKEISVNHKHKDISQMWQSIYKNAYTYAIVEYWRHN